MREYARRANQLHEGDAKAAPTRAISSNVPNSEMAAMYGYSDATDASLDEVLRSRIERILHYRDKQIPAAEQEAEKMAASVTNARAPEDVKSALGERMGADFSDVRFHTDASAAQKADNLGARAYTTGSDVYFGEEGFDPGIAAHELVHTAQQGAVQSGVPTVAAPMGGVQMEPRNPFKMIRDAFRSKATAPAPPPAQAPAAPPRGARLGVPMPGIGEAASACAALRTTAGSAGTSAAAAAPTLVADIGSAPARPAPRPDSMGAGTSAAEAPVQSHDPEYDAAAEQKGFLGGLGRRIVSPGKFVGRKLKGIFGGASMDATAKRMAAESTPSTAADIGDAARYAANVTPSRGEAATDSPIPALVPPLAAAAAETGVNTVGGLFNGSGFAHGVPGQFGGLRDLAEGTIKVGAGTVAGQVGGAVSGIGGAIGAMQNFSKGGTSLKGGNTADAAQASLQAMQSLSTGAGGVAKIFGYAGLAPGAIAGSVLPGVNVATGGIQAVKGTVGAVSGARTQRHMTSQIAKLAADKDAAPEAAAGFSDQQRRSMMRTMHMAREMGAINKEAGIGQVVAGGLTAAGGIATLSGAGALAGTVLAGAGTGMNVLSGFNKTVQVEDMRRRVVDQELGMAERTHGLDQELRDRGNPGQYSKATKERIILQRMGFNSGTKHEVFANIAMNRSKMMTDTANASTLGVQDLRKADPDADDKKKRLQGEAKYDWTGKEEELKQYRQRKFARETLKGMGLSKVKLTGGSSGYAQQGVAEKIGMDAGIDIHHQLAVARKGKAPQEVLDEERALVRKNLGKLDPAKDPKRVEGFRRRQAELGDE